MRTLLLAILSFLLAVGGLRAQCLSGDCQNGKGILLYPNSERYVGQFWRGKQHGEGTYYYNNGSRYQGQWAQGRPHGTGFKLFKDGTRLEGEWEKGKLVRRVERLASLEEYVARGGSREGCISGNCQNGKGIYIYPSGAVYIGDFREGEIHGVGVCYYSDGSKYQGEWAHRYPEGNGTKTYSDGSRLTGYWKKGQPVDSYGNLLSNVINTKEAGNDGTEIQTGCLAGDCEKGRGTFAYADGSRYEGQFFEGRPEGWGTFYYVNGETYTGSFREGVPHGRGRLESVNGVVRRGEWRHGEYLVPNATGRSPGCIEGDCENGYGTYVFKDGSRYTGTFKNFLPHGRGTVRYTNGERYEGEMAEATFNGQGTLFMPDGTRVTGRWRQGTYLGNVADQQAGSGFLVAPADPFSQDLRPRPQGKVWAVIIGVAAYDHMPVLRYTDDDAYRIYAFLKSPEGGALDDRQIRILIDEDATKKKILDAMNETFGKAGPNDLVFLYFSGHGLKGSFLPIDFDGYNNKLYHEEINEIFDRSRAKLKLCIADACHSGSLLAMRGEERRPTLVSYYENLAKARAGTALIMSSKSDETSLESSGLRQGVFSHFLIRGLKGEADLDADQVVTVQELYNFIFANVRSYTGNRQSPVIKGDYDETMMVAVKR